MQINSTRKYQNTRRMAKKTRLMTSNADEVQQLACIDPGNVTRYDRFRGKVWQFLVKLNAQQFKS